jgi:uncharacterized protein
MHRRFCTSLAVRLSLAVLPLLLAGCANGYFYHPNQTVYSRPSDRGLSYENVAFRSADGTRLTGWFLPARGKAKGTVIHFHGNAGNMTGHFGYVDWLPFAGFNLLVFDYRGYGQSEGRPGREGVYQDSLAAIQYVGTRKDVDPNRLLIFGQSLGGANAIAVVGGENPEGVRAIAVESAFSSYRQIVRDKIAQIPILSLLRWPLSFVVVTNGRSPDAVIADIAPIPLLIFHGTHDRVVPYSHGKRLFEKAGDPKALIPIPEAGHTQALHLGNAYRHRLIAFFEAALSETPSARKVAAQ